MNGSKVVRLEALESRRMFALGELDPAFGSGGSVAVDQGAVQPSVVAQPDGKLLVCTSNGVLRLNGDGSVDTGFGANGYTINAGFSPVDAKLTSSGEIVVAGTMNKSIAVAEYHADGSLVTGFGVNGVVTIAPPNGFYQLTASGLVVQSTGKIVVGGELDSTGNFPESDPSGTYEIYFCRINPDGTVDTTYGDNGATEIEHNFAVSTVSLLANDSVAASALMVGSGARELDAVGWEMDRDGKNPDPIGYANGLGGNVGLMVSLSGGETVDVESADFRWTLRAAAQGAGPYALKFSSPIESLVPTSDNKLLVFSQQGATGGSLVVERYNAELTLDSSFAPGGYRIMPEGSQQIGRAALMPDGSVVLPGLARVEMSGNAIGPSATSVALVAPKLGKRWAYVTVNYAAGQAALNPSTVASQGLQVVGPTTQAGDAITANLVSSGGDGQSVSAVYAFSVPSRHFSRADNGGYTFIVAANAIKDVNGVGNVGGPLSADTVYVPRRNRGAVMVIPASIPLTGLPINLGVPAVAAGKKRGSVFLD